MNTRACGDVMSLVNPGLAAAIAPPDSPCDKGDIEHAGSHELSTSSFQLTWLSRSLFGVLNPRFHPSCAV